jgi:hypothetical protein
MFGETPELFFPTDNLLKISAGDWTSDTVIRVVATANSPNNLVGQTITQTTDPSLDATTATASVESTLQLQEGEVTVYQLLLNLDSIDGTFVTGAEISGTDNTNADIAVTATIQSILVEASVTDGSSGYTTADTVTVTSSSGKDSLISIVDVGSGEVDQVIIDNPGTGYTIGDNLYFNNLNTEGTGASAMVTNIGGAIAPELGDTTDHIVTGNCTSASYTITNITTTSLYAATQIEVTGKVTTSSTSISNITTTNLIVGATIIGTGIPASATISSINTVGNHDNGTITISAAATSGGASGTFRTLTQLEEGTGQKISGSNLPANTTIRQITVIGSSNNGTIIVSGAALASATGAGFDIVSEYGMATSNHIIFDPATEATDAYSGAQMQIETGTWLNNSENYPTTSDGGLNLPAEKDEIVNIIMNSKGSGYEVIPTVVPTEFRLYWNITALTTTSEFTAGETITNNAGTPVTGIIATLRAGIASVASTTGSFAQGQIITGASSGAVATLTSVTTLGSNATCLAWSSSGIGSVTGVEVTKFGTGFTGNPTVTVPVKLVITRNTAANPIPDISTASAFAVGDPISGQTSSATGVITSWDNTRQLLTVRTTLGTFIKGEIITRGVSTNYAFVAETAQATLSGTIGVVGTTAGAFNNDKGKISESLMKIQDSYYYQDFSYVVRVGAAIASWRSEIKKSVHPAGFAMFGEVSLSNKVEVKLTVPVSGITSATPTLASIFEAVITTVIGRRLGTQDDSTTILGETVIRGTTDQKTGSTLKRGYHLGHKTPLTSSIESITRSSTTATVETTGPHGVEAGEVVEISGVSSTGYNGVHEVVSVTDDTFTFTVLNSLATPAVLGNSASVLLISPFDTSTRDVTLKSYKDVSIYPIYGGWASLQKNRYGLGPRQSNAIKYMFAAPPITGDSVPTRLGGGLEYAYPNMTRRKSPEARTDNVDAGSLVGNYDNAFGYTIIQIGTHESNSHMPIGSFGDIRIVDIVRGCRVLGESGTPNMEHQHEDLSEIIMEDGSTIEMEGVYTIPQESRKIWNVPPPSYVRLITA